MFLFYYSVFFSWYLSLVLTVFAINCDDGEIKITLRKNSIDMADEEKVNIYNGNVKVLSSPTFVDFVLYDNDFCLPATTNMQYTLEMSDE